MEEVLDVFDIVERGRSRGSLVGFLVVLGRTREDACSTRTYRRSTPPRLCTFSDSSKRWKLTLEDAEPPEVADAALQLLESLRARL